MRNWLRAYPAAVPVAVEQAGAQVDVDDGAGVALICSRHGAVEDESCTEQNVESYDRKSSLLRLLDDERVKQAEGCNSPKMKVVNMMEAPMMASWE